ncbi:hypothetical protein ACFY1U_25245 [Streptomyces sp. NPDC001351]|uniref:hypothetical protein n=1 Tax=Streptomyces sp. NPDC001351 TaxID=3364564 RepID=UPI00369A6F44
MDRVASSCTPTLHASPAPPSPRHARAVAKDLTGTQAENPGRLLSVAVAVSALPGLEALPQADAEAAAARAHFPDHREGNGRPTR